MVSTELTAPVAGKIQLLSPMTTLYLAHVATDLNVCFPSEPISIEYAAATKAKNWEMELETAPRKGLVQA